MTKLAVFASLLLFALAPEVRADNGCSNADLQGAYSFLVSGTVSAGNPLGLPAGAAFAAAGLTMYEGNGKAYGVIQISLDGAITQVLTWSADYNLDPSGCTLTKTITIDHNSENAPYGGVQLHFFGSAGDNFKELRFITTDAGTAITGTARKQ
jgi:hypothetical protein